MTTRFGLLQAGIVATAVVAGLLASGAMVLRGTEAVFTANTSNAANAWTAGTVNLNTTGTAMFALPNLMVPSQTVVKCITVNYTGNVPAAVKVYSSPASLTGTLGPYLDLKIEEANTNGTIPDTCAGFPAATVLYNATIPGASPGTLTDFGGKTTYNAGVGNGWTPSSSTTSRAYRFTVTLKSTTPGGMQGATAGLGFTWEAQAGS